VVRVVGFVDLIVEAVVVFGVLVVLRVFVPFTCSSASSCCA
jgi:hypothetical protein